MFHGHIMYTHIFQIEGVNTEAARVEMYKYSNPRTR